jgi:hypothetical protein
MTKKNGIHETLVMIALSACLFLGACGVARAILGVPEATATNPNPKSEAQKAADGLFGGTPIGEPITLLANAATLLYALWSKKQAGAAISQATDAKETAANHEDTIKALAATIDQIQKQLSKAA